MEEQTALQIYTEWLAKHPDDIAVLFKRADLYKFMEKYPQAIADFRLSAKTKDKIMSGHSYLGIGECFDRLGKDAEGDKAYAEAHKAFGDQAFLLYRLSTRALKANDGKAALQYANLLLAKHEPDAHLYRGEAYLLLGQTEKALAEFSILIPEATKVFRHQASATSTTYKTSMTLRKALDGRAKCYDLLGKHDLAESDRRRHRDMDREIFENTPFLKDKN